MGSGAFLPLLVLLVLLPVGALAVLLALRREGAPPHPARVILLLGGIGALATACLGFTRMSMPIGPYESLSNPWPQVVAPLLFFAYAGFGLGGALGVVLVIPGWLARRRSNAKRDPVPGPGDPAGDLTGPRGT